jgi:hypothetical protein
LFSPKSGWATVAELKAARPVANYPYPRNALPKMAKAAQSEELKSAFQKHETETEEHVARLEKVFEEIDETPRGKTCDAIMGIIEEGQEPKLTPGA